MVGSMLRRCLIFLLLLSQLLPPAAANPVISLPELGGGTLRLLAGTSEASIGRQITAELRRNGLLIEDPELNEYIQHVGSRLVAASDHQDTRFTFFIVRDDTVNAFALPGGYIGIHSGLLLKTRTESELASVLAHEVAHVTQRHVARRFEANSSLGLKGLAVLLGAIALAAAGAGGDDVTGAMMLGQGMLAQEQINFTREQEYEADYIGVEMLARAGFDPRGMVSFFETMQRAQRIQNSRMPEFLSTHPLSMSRVIESSQRVQKMTPGEAEESRNYPLMKARLGVLAGNVVAGVSDNPLGKPYADALQAMRTGKPQQAVKMFEELLASDDSITHYHIGLGMALLQAREAVRAQQVMERAHGLFPHNVPVVLAHAQVLRQTDRANEALVMLRDLFNRHEPVPDEIRVLAQVAAEAGETAESHFYMSEYYIRFGNLGAARDHLTLAVNGSRASSKERLQYEARLKEVTDALLEMRRNSRRQAQN